MRLAALILTGGRSERMGRPKEFLPFGADTFLGHTVRTTHGCADPVVVIRRSPDQKLPPLPTGAEVIGDEQPESGPLAAIATGLRHLRQSHGFAVDDAAFVTGCDTPLLTAEVIRGLAGRLAGVDLAVPVHEGVRQPLCAVYRLRTLETIDAMIAQGIARLRLVTEHVSTRLLDEHDLRDIDPELRFLRNVNTSDDYEQLRRDRDRPD